MKGNWKSIIKASFILSLFAVSSSFIGGYGESDNSWVMTITLLAGLLSSIYIISLNKYFRNHGQVKNMSMGDTVGAITSFSDILDLIVLSLLQNIMIALWTLLFIIPGIIKGLAYSQAINIYFDYKETGNKIGYMEAITKSRKLMDGNKMDYFILSLRFIPIIFLVIVIPFFLVIMGAMTTVWFSIPFLIIGGVILFIGLIYIFNYMSLTYSIYYRDLYKEK